MMTLCALCLAGALAWLALRTTQFSTGRIDEQILDALTGSGPVSISPDGRKLLQRVQLPTQFEARILELATSQTLARFKTTQSPFAFRWRPDSSSVAFLMGARPPFSLHVMTTSGSVKQLTPLLTYANRGPEWEPHGSRLAYLQTDGKTRLLLLSAEPADKPPGVVCEHVASNSNFAWSPDARRLAVTESPSLGTTISICTDAGQLTRQILPLNEGQIRSIAWSNRGDTLLASVRSPSDERFFLVAVDVDKGTTRPLVAANEDILGPQFLSSGTSFTYHLSSSGQMKVVLADSQTTCIRILSPPGTHCTVLDEAPDNGGIYMVSQRLDCARSVIRVSLSCQAQTVLPAQTRCKQHPRPSELVSLEASDHEKSLALLWRPWKSRVPSSAIIDVSASASPMWDPLKQLAIERGIHYVAIIPRGSPGYGQSYENRLNTEGQILDLVALCDYVREELQVSPEHTILLGKSHGTELVCGALQDLKVRPSHLLLVGTVPRVELWGELIEQPRTLLAFHGQYDASCSPQMALDSLESIFGKAVFRRKPNRWRIVRDEGHFFYLAQSWAEIYTAAFDLLERTRTE